ncbi:Glyoxalase/Bleomycin resistance protein/Dihydroxybiphenyl dioxygenase [Lipomyces arxii]|uniref:Glyoxalase/Bleomycin resistance protein/Dihydroxybiphenyl dioxygenase n=1 Tax=Lipomyces arxii TaxID=56418 RepID=UPI0034CE9085
MSANELSLSGNREAPSWTRSTIIPPMPTALSHSMLNYFSITFACNNAKAFAGFHTSRMGFHPVARKQMQKHCHRTLCSEVVRNGNILLEFVSPVAPLDNSDIAMDEEERKEALRIVKHLEKHGDSIIDVALTVSSVIPLYEWAIKQGAKSIVKPKMIKDDYGEVVYATVNLVGDITHTLVDHTKYIGPFLPGYEGVFSDDPLNAKKAAVPFSDIDHCVCNVDWGKMAETCDLYQKVLGFHQFISEDDYNVTTEYSALKSTVMASANDLVKMPVTEPAKGRHMSQIEEYLRYNNGPGYQHIALRTPDIITCISEMRNRGIEFIDVPKSYYDDLRERLSMPGAPKIREDMNLIESLNILVDFDKDGYLLQLFVKDHVSSRPTSFYEIIQREGSKGFGAGNFKALFEAIEREQAKRGNLD